MNKLLLGVLGLVVVVGVVLLLVSNKPYQGTPSQVVSPTPQVTQQPKTETSSPSATTMEEVSVTIINSGFSPQTLAVKTGTKVVWVNKSGGVVSVNSVVHPTHLVYPPLNIGNIKDGVSVSLVFDKAGTYKYHNHLNTSQAGTVVVE